MFICFIIIVIISSSSSSSSSSRRRPRRRRRRRSSSSSRDYKFHLYKCRTPAGLGTFSLGWGLPTLGCLCEALSNIETMY